MKKDRRTEMFCSKELKRNVYERFRIIVKTDDLVAAKAKYENLGYLVRIPKTFI